MKHIFIVAGEASGDVYGAQLIRALREHEPDIKIAGFGGDLMAQAGMNLLYNLVREFSVMGFAQVVLGLPKVMNFLKLATTYLDQQHPDMVILIDYPGFNLHLAGIAKYRGIRTVYYITPQIWAWASWRIRKIQRRLDKMLVIFPFEVPFYQKANVPVEYVGHPILDKIQQFQPDPDFANQHKITQESKVLALLPGSRGHIIQRNLPILLWLAHQLAQKEKMTHLFLPLALEQYQLLVQQIWEQFPQKHELPTLKIICGQTYDVLHSARLALVTSGTATLETALLKTPLIILYQAPKIYKWFLNHTAMLNCRYFGLPNIISSKMIVPEFLVTESEPNYLISPTLKLWQDTPERQKCLDDMAQLYPLLGNPGASERAAKAVIAMLKECKQ